MIDLSRRRYAHMVARQEFALESEVVSKPVIHGSRWLEAIWRPLVSDVECAGADRHRGPGSCMPAFSVYGPITSRLEEKINRRRGTDDVSLQPDDRPMRRGRRRPISTEQSISKDIQRCRQQHPRIFISTMYEYVSNRLLLLTQKSNPTFVTNP